VRAYEDWGPAARDGGSTHRSQTSPLFSFLFRLFQLASLVADQSAKLLCGSSAGIQLSLLDKNWNTPSQLRRYSRKSVNERWHQAHDNNMASPVFLISYGGGVGFEPNTTLWFL
jgi:hypothetical protein